MIKLIKLINFLLASKKINKTYIKKTYKSANKNFKKQFGNQEKPHITSAENREKIEKNIGYIKNLLQNTIGSYLWILYKMKKTKYIN